MNVGCAVVPNHAEWQSFYGLMRERTGVDLNKYVAHQMQRRIVSMMQFEGFESLCDLGGWLSSSPTNTENFLDRVAINVTALFRDPEKWNEMRHKVLPELLERSATLKIWSAGCSKGAEAYSMASLLAAYFPGNHQVIGTDIDQSALAQAREGRFTESDMRCVPGEYKAAYFLESENTWFARPELKRYVRFKTGNLLEDRFESGFDLIICRNVVIYFTEDVKQDLYRRFVNSLRDHGILFVGSTERIVTCKDVGLETALPFFYKKSATEGRKWRNAS